MTGKTSHNIDYTYSNKIIVGSPEFPVKGGGFGVQACPYGARLHPKSGYLPPRHTVLRSVQGKPAGPMAEIPSAATSLSCRVSV
jgi:hypothetical protein